MTHRHKISTNSLPPLCHPRHGPAPSLFKWDFESKMLVKMDDWELTSYFERFKNDGSHSTILMETDEIEKSTPNAKKYKYDNNQNSNRSILSKKTDKSKYNKQKTWEVYSNGNETGVINKYTNEVWKGDVKIVRHLLPNEEKNFPFFNKITKEPLIMTDAIFEAIPDNKVIHSSTFHASRCCYVCDFTNEWPELKHKIKKLPPIGSFGMNIFFLEENNFF